MEEAGRLVPVQMQVLSDICMQLGRDGMVTFITIRPYAQDVGGFHRCRMD